MIELRKDIWEIYDLQMPDIYAICITINGYVKRDGRAVMGRGVAAQAKARFPGIDKEFGEAMRADGNRVRLLQVRTDSLSSQAKRRLESGLERRQSSSAQVPERESRSRMGNEGIFASHSAIFAVAGPITSRASMGESLPAPPGLRGWGTGLDAGEAALRALRGLAGSGTNIEEPWFVLLFPAWTGSPRESSRRA